ncbi:hypothetical protein SBOR_6464 [Sclerotinia borealis F-4128]|uniref:DUF676 domain-containing protein n=1 Tax=Sclerotinia borealis (strain F-4128) TaxID=1432307 RepID=W9C8Q3_SCLBF|nr:hypothetical protein SBOR_6464 [Sclerotinia borealis F-4128]
MLLLYQAGSVKIGEIVRYTVTYTPAHDRILPSPARLHLKIKNTSAIALRAAFVHGPYTLYAAAYPSTFNPNVKCENPRRDGVPEFEPNLKAGGSFSTELVVPEDVRKTAGSANRDGRSPGRNDADVKSVTWIIEVTSQVVFSNSAAVHYEILLGRDAKSLALGFAAGSILGGTAPVPGQVHDHQQSQGAKDGHHAALPRGVYSRAIRVRVDDTASLWNTPKLDDRDKVVEEQSSKGSNKVAPVEDATGEGHIEENPRKKRRKNVHLVVLTHGLHSNLGADMLFLKESIDATAKQAKIDAKARKTKKREEEKQRRAAARAETKEGSGDGDLNRQASTEDLPEEQEEPYDESEDEDEVIVRGFSGNVVRTERGIKYLGKRLAKYVLTMTYPDQPFRPTIKKSATEALSHALKPDSSKLMDDSGKPVHENSSIIKVPQDVDLPYHFTSISFIAHSLGGLVQTYAIAYIQKHSPQFFDIIKPINFIALASPFLGLSNENPLYVKFALDFGLVGRTGQDLGLTWRAPTIARSGWGALVGNIGENAHKRLDGESAPEAKPLLRILPTGPAHTVLKKFRNRTVYSNVVNDGIVPLRTSCLLFLDWQSLGRVEKARRENGLVGTMAEWSWAELTGANSGSPAKKQAPLSDEEVSDIDDITGNASPAVLQRHETEVPQPSAIVMDDDRRSLKNLDISGHSTISSIEGRSSTEIGSPTSTSFSSNNNGPLASLFGFFRSNPSPKPNVHQPKHSKIYKRSQTIKINNDSESSTPSLSPTPEGRSKVSAGNTESQDTNLPSAPPKTTFFESAGDLLKPPLPSTEFLIDPSSRARTIFHDRVYHPSDIPPLPLKKRSTLLRRRNSSISEPATPTTASHTDSQLSALDYDDPRNSTSSHPPNTVVDSSAMKVEEKIARAYHRDLSWRKVLVSLEPDAHNNMIVRRMFANAYGWPVVKHLCDTHFSDDAIARRKDEDTGGQERAKAVEDAPGSEGQEVDSSVDDRNLQKTDEDHITRHDRTNSEAGEARDSVSALGAPTPSMKQTSAPIRTPSWSKKQDGYESAGWSDRDWVDSADESEEDENKLANSGWNWTEKIVGKGANAYKSQSGSPTERGTDRKEISQFLRKGPLVASPEPVEGNSKELGRGGIGSGDCTIPVLSKDIAGMGIGLDGISVGESEVIPQHELMPPGRKD